MIILINKSKMENYVKDILFKERVKHLDELNIETLVIFNKDILDKIVENLNIDYYKNKLLKLEKCIIKPLIDKDANKLYEKLVEILNNSFDIGEDDEIYELFTEEVSKYVIMCINSSTFDLEKLVWDEILKGQYYGDGNEDEIIKGIIKKNKKIDVRLFLNFSKYGSYAPFSRFRQVITVDNIPDEIDNTTCNYIKNNFTLQYTNITKNGLFLRGPEIEYKYNKDGSIVITNNNRLKVIVKILMNCKSLMLISEYLKEEPVFDLNEEDPLYFVGRYEDENREIYELQKEEFKRLLKKELKSRVDNNTRLYIRLRKIIESHTGRSDIMDMKVNSYEKKLKKVIDGESISRS
jgi:hypothetical protein